jgi:hypothetical protein
VRQLSVGPGPAGTLLVVGDSGNPTPSLIQNVDLVNIIYLGKHVGVNPNNPLECAPLNPGQTTVASGDVNIFGIASPGQTVAINVYEGVMSFFQPLSQLSVAGPQAAILIYSPNAGQGNLVGSWSGAPQPYQDQYGNTVNPGLFANQGSLSSMILQAATLYGANLQQPLVDNANINVPSIYGGTIQETEINFDTTDGFVLMYGTTTTTITNTTPGHTTWTSPVTGPAVIRVWGADGGAGGGGPTWGGTGGGAGEYGGEAHYQLVINQVYPIDVGKAGTGANTGGLGTNGGDSGFDNFAVLGGGGSAGGSGGNGGNKSTNTWHFPGGNGGGSGAGAGSGGGGRAGTLGPGGNGVAGGATVGGAGGAAGAGIGGAVGATGGGVGANGNNGPGGGSGCGMASSAQTGTTTYYMGASATYYGSDASGGNANNQRNLTTPLYQGGETASGGAYNGTQKSLCVISGNVQADMTGKTIDSVTIQFTNQHSWYGSGQYINLGYNNRTSLPSSWNAADITNVGSYWINQGATTVYDVTNTGLPAALQSGAAKALTLGPGSPNMNLWNYGFFSGPGTGYGPVIVITWHTGSVPVKAGNGGNGRVDIIYTNTQTLVGALSPVAGTDAGGNAYDAAYTGLLSAFQPGSNPSVVESWHSVSPPSPLTGTMRYRYRGTRHVEIKFDLVVPGTASSGTITLFTLPSAYWPLNNYKSNTPGCFTNAPTSITQLASVLNMRFQVTTAGVVQVLAFPGGASGPGITEMDGAYLVPLD